MALWAVAGMLCPHNLYDPVSHAFHRGPPVGLLPGGCRFWRTLQPTTYVPGVYFENEFGIRIEDTVILTNSGINRFFTDGKELMIIK